MESNVGVPPKFEVDVRVQSLRPEVAHEFKFWMVRIELKPKISGGNGQ